MKDSLNWKPASKPPTCKPVVKTVCFGSIRGVSQTAKMDARDSAPILMRIAELPTRNTGKFGPNGRFLTEPNPRAGQYYYTVGYFRRYNRKEKGYEDERGYECTPDEWTYLPNAADYRQNIMANKRKMRGYVVLRQLYNGARWDSRQGWRVISSIVNKETAESIIACHSGMVPHRISRQYTKLPKANF